jgi:hypothetical protein
MIFEGAFVFRITHVPEFRHEYLTTDKPPVEWTSEDRAAAWSEHRSAAFIFPTHALADDRAKELRTPEAWAAARTVTGSDPEQQLPSELRDHEPVPTRKRRARGPQPEVKLFGYANA